MAGIWYRTGTIALTQGSADVSGAGTAFYANVKAGDMFIGPIMDMYEVTDVISDGQIRIDRPYEGVSYTGTDWCIAPTSAQLRQLAQQITSLVALYQDIPEAATEAQAARDTALGYRNEAQAARDAASASADSASTVLQNVQAEAQTIAQSVQEATDAAVSAAALSAQEAAASAGASADSATTSAEKASDAAQSAADAATTLADTVTAKVASEQARDAAEAARDAALSYSQIAKPFGTYADVAGFPETGEDGKGYVAADTDTLYRWDGEKYVEVSPKPENTDDVPEGAQNLYYTPTRTLTDLGSNATGVRQELGVYSESEVDDIVGQRVPIVAPGDIPESDQGPIATPNEGLMRWQDGADIYVPYVAYNNCRLDGGPDVKHITLSRFDGDALTVGGRTFVIPEAGISYAPTGVPDSGVHYIYAYNNNGSLAFENNAVPRMVGPDGRQIKQGDSSRLLVGMISADNSGNIPDGMQTGRFVASWYNPIFKICWNANSGAATSSTQPIAAMTMWPILCWRGRAFDFRLVTRSTNTVANATCFTQIYDNQSGAAMTPWATAQTTPQGGGSGTGICLASAVVNVDQLIRPAAMINVGSGSGSWFLHSVTGSFL